MTYANSRAVADTLGTTYLAAGSYPVSLVYYQGGGGDSMEFYAAKESNSTGATSFDANSILVARRRPPPPPAESAPPLPPCRHKRSLHGKRVSSVPPSSDERAIDRECGHCRGGQHLALFADHLQRSQPGVVDEPDLADAIRCGYVAYLNGVEIASSNAPTFARLELDGRGAGQRRAGRHLPGRRRLVVPEFGHHRPPHGHRQRAGDPDAAGPAHGPEPAGPAGVVPDDERHRERPYFFHARRRARPTRWATYSPDVTFSTVHGFLYASPPGDAHSPTSRRRSIYYTTDNSAAQRASNGTLYIGPVTISTRRRSCRRR